MDSSSQSEYNAFEEKLSRTVYIDNLSPQVNESILKTAMNQFGVVKSIQFIPNYLEPKNIPQCALVEMTNLKQAKAVVSELTQFPFMIAGMPRPVRGRPAEAEMFDERPVKPGRRIHCQWLEPSNPDFEAAKKLKRIARKHDAEASFMLQQLLKQEEKLGKEQGESLKANYKKYEMLDGLMADKTARDLAHYYDMRVSDDY